MADSKRISDVEVSRQSYELSIVLEAGGEMEKAARYLRLSLLYDPNGTKVYSKDECLEKFGMYGCNEENLPQYQSNVHKFAKKAYDVGDHWLLKNSRHRNNNPFVYQCACATIHAPKDSELSRAINSSGPTRSAKPAPCSATAPASGPGSI